MYLYNALSTQDLIFAETVSQVKIKVSYCYYQNWFHNLQIQ